jgi:hypothetical protein
MVPGKWEVQRGGSPAAAPAGPGVLLVPGHLLTKEIVVPAILASNVSARIEELILRHDGGDRTAAARRLGLDAERLAGLLSGDWSRFSLDGFAAMVRCYGVTLDSLIASPRVPQTEERQCQ